MSIGLGIYEVGQRFCADQIDFPAFKSALRELAGLGRSAIWKSTKFLEQCCNDGAASMHLKLGAILAGKAVRCFEEQGHGLVEHFPVTCTKTADVHPTSLGRFA